MTWSYLHLFVKSKITIFSYFWKVQDRFAWPFWIQSISKSFCTLLSLLVIIHSCSGFSFHFSREIEVYRSFFIFCTLNHPIQVSISFSSLIKMNILDAFILGFFPLFYCLFTSPILFFFFMLEKLPMSLFCCNLGLICNVRSLSTYSSRWFINFVINKSNYEIYLFQLFSFF